MGVRCWIVHLLLSAFALCVGWPAAAAEDDYRIGTFYFPGWRENQAGAPAQQPWDRIKLYPEREPLLGWYDDGDVGTLNKQLAWMYDYGIDFVVFDWYWSGAQTFLGHAINAYLKTENKKKVPFSLLWANHTDTPKTQDEFVKMVDFWLHRYFQRPEYLKLDGKPVVFVFSHPEFLKQSKRVGLHFSELLRIADFRAREMGYKGIYFIGGTHVHPDLIKRSKESGYSAFSAYNYHGRAEKESESYAELDSAYRFIWDYILKNSDIPYVLPMTQGWDKRPWGGSKNPLHDNSGGSAKEFRTHLLAARNVMDANPEKTMKMGVICCWNEFGEGSIIEPTRRHGFSYLEQVRSVFGARSRVQ